MRPKNDFSHAYVYSKTAHSTCHSEDASSLDPMLVLGGHVGDNEGDHFWGFEFDKNKPTNFDKLEANSGESFTLTFNRSIGDILVSFTIPGSASSPAVLEIYRVTGFTSNGSAIFSLVATAPNCGGTEPAQGNSELATNETNDVTAPPWNVPVCDPTGEDSANQCRLANGASATGDHLLAPRDFAEAMVDLYAFDINPCFSNVIFTSRSAHVLDGADVQDVGGATFPLCGAKSGTKFKDLNANGVKDTGEPALSGWTMKLYQDKDSSGTLNAADDNDTNGYAFHVSGGDLPGNDFGNYQSDFGNTPQSHITVSFVAATLPDTGSPAATKATSIACHDTSNGCRSGSIGQRLRVTEGNARPVGARLPHLVHGSMI